MERLDQKCHGLPGLCVNGNIGKTGKRGHSVYFGHIDDFFDGARIQIDNYVYVAKRITDRYAEWEKHIKELNQALIYKMPDISGLLNPEYYSYYYTGVIYKYDPDYSDNIDTSTQLKPLYTYKIDFSNDSQLMSAMIDSAGGNTVIFKYNQSVFPVNKIESIEVQTQDGTTYTYSEMYNYDVIGGTATIRNDGHLQIKRDGKIPIITYDSNDAAYLAYDNAPDPKFNTEWLFDKGITNIGMGKHVISFLNNQLEQTVFYEPNSIWTISELIKGPDKTLLVTDTNMLYATVTSDLSQSSLIYTEGEYLNGISSTLPFDPNQFFKTSIISDEILYADDITDDDGFAYYGIPGKILFNENISKKVSIKTINENVKVKSLSKEYIDDIKKYQNYNRTDISTGYIKYIPHDNNTLVIPTTLKDEYQEGDILYFYTNKNDKYANHMVIITKDLLKCNKAQMLKYSSNMNPFSIKYLENINKDIFSNTGMSIIRADVSTQQDLQSVKSIMTIMDNYNKAGIILANNYIDPSIISLDAISDSSYKFSASIKNNMLNIISSDVKMESMYINKKYKVNTELYSGVYDNNIILYGDFLKSIESIQSFIDINGNPYVCAKLYATDYFYNTDNMTNYIYGFDILDDKMTVIQHMVTSELSIDMRIPVYTNTKLFYVLVWASTVGGIKHYSKLMYIDVDCQKVDPNTLDTLQKNIQIQKQSFHDLSLKQKKINDDILTDQKKMILKKQQYIYIITKCDIHEKEIVPFVKEKNLHKVNYKLYNKLTAEWTEPLNDISLNIMINDDYKLLNILFNHTDISNGQINSWSSIRSSNLGEYSLSVSSNIPDCSTLQDYVLRDSSIDNNDSYLFNNIAKGIPAKKTDSRSILVTACYTEKIQSAILYDTSNFLSTYKLYPYNAYIYDSSYNDITNKTSIYYVHTNLNSIIIKANEEINENILKDDYFKVQPSFTSDNTLTYTFNNLDTSINSSIKYGKDNIYYENFYITQPGFTDTRDIPNITLKMHNNIADTQTYNTLENNVLCNQFITYLDINIDDFKNKWGQFLDNDTSISMTMEISNIMSDIDWQTSNIVGDNICIHPTIKLCTENTSKDYTHNSNYVLLYPSLIRTDKDLIYVTNDEPEYTTNNCSININISLYNSLVDKPINISTYHINNRDYIFIDSSVVKYNSQSEFIYSGIHENININFDNITINEFNDNTLHLKLLYEFGNPMISNLYLRFAVNKIIIHVSNKKGSTDFIATVLDSISANEPYCKRLIQYTGNNDYQYSYISEPLNVMVNPLSYTVCPIELESHITNMTGSVYKAGSEQQIQKQLKFFNSSIYNNELLMNSTADIIRTNKYMNWSGIKLKKSYFQDNIKNIHIQAVNNIQNIHKDNLYKYAYPDSNALSKMSNTYNYMGIIYNGGIMQPKLRDGIYTFYYDNTQFELNRYSQYGNKKPVFLNDSIIMNLRSDSLYNSIQVWNKEYVDSKQPYNDKLFNGNISLFGNGYMMLYDSKDTNQYQDDIYSLAETKKQNDIYVYDVSVFENVINMNNNNDEPATGYYYRTFLYDLNMEYVVPINNNESEHYQISNDFDILSAYLKDKNMLPKIYENKITNLLNKNTHIIPYSLLYDIYPRICYNSDAKTINVLMLRMPSLQYDTDIYDESNYIYSLNKHYFEILPNQTIGQIQENYKN
ncbi:MAG: hypothetical protein [Wendovervirus sonii]|uniref:Uncharacterized protein n=1 Tax=phage Lak_Megaphage_Sonny TaxID=3109229 RepID=A0ABZ0Z5Q8_9CAUD|nr:MAG: hypothetical protein [phage Lak_Megaphage_Sonny]